MTHVADRFDRDGRDLGAAYALVLAAYANQFTRLDANDADAFASSFTDDGRLYISGRGWFHGRSAIADFVRSTAERRPRHFYSQIAPLELTRHLCRAQGTFLMFDDDAGEMPVHGMTRDRLRYATGSGWLFEEARVLILWTSQHYATRGRTSIESDIAAHIAATG